MSSGPPPSSDTNEARSKAARHLVKSALSYFYSRASFRGTVPGSPDEARALFRRMLLDNILSPGALAIALDIPACTVSLWASASPVHIGAAVEDKLFTFFRRAASRFTQSPKSKSPRHRHSAPAGDEQSPQCAMSLLEVASKLSNVASLCADRAVTDLLARVYALLPAPPSEQREWAVEVVHEVERIVSEVQHSAEAESAGELLQALFVAAESARTAQSVFLQASSSATASAPIAIVPGNARSPRLSSVSSRSPSSGGSAGRRSISLSRQGVDWGLQCPESPSTSPTKRLSLRNAHQEPSE